MGVKKSEAWRAWVGESKGKSPLGRLRYKWGYVIMVIKEGGREDMKWIQLHQNMDHLWAVVNTLLWHI